MRRLITWVGIFVLAVWATLRVLRELDQPHTSIIDSVSPRTDKIAPAPADVEPSRLDGIVPNTNTIDSAPSTDSPSLNATDPEPPADPCVLNTDVKDSASADVLLSDKPQLEAYCARCRERRILNDVQEETTANGRRAARGACSVCGTTVFTFLSAKPRTKN